MAVSQGQISDTVGQYLTRFPDERNRLERLTDALAGDSAITSRKEFNGHVTCGVVILDADWRVLHIRHNALGRWLLPGGHLEPEDLDLVDAALREAREETGLVSTGLRLLEGCGDIPLDIDVHAIPENADKEEPHHWHFDLRFAFNLAGSSPVRLQAEEVSGYDWLDFDAMPAVELTKKLANHFMAGQ
ncbi:NUDIX hydrolase [Krasilnikovia sp. MM14-A1259]|uniref:NUDIX hydrolase n=1 Tax=Krasilnikovia sp. MM14-A1259 TaxID=3373539 RepID=UPI003824A548